MRAPFAAQHNAWAAARNRSLHGSYIIVETAIMKSPAKNRISAWMIALVAASAIFLTLQSAAQSKNQRASDTKSRSVDLILDRYANAVGGLPAWKKSTTRVIKGNVELSPPPMTGKVELYQAAPDKMFFKMTVPRLGISWVLVNGNEAWQKDFGSEPRRLSGNELSDAKIDADFYKEVDLRRLYSRMEYGGTAIVDSRTADVVRAFNAAGQIHTLYFDKDTGLLVREDFVSNTAHGPETVHTLFSDYRDLKDAGIKYPFSVKQVNERAAQTLRFEDVLHNVPVDNSLFTAPAH